MPIYEYRCSKCGDFEAMQKISDKPLTQCPKCRRKVTKLISATTFHLKGSGWYVTDYARKGEAASSPAGATKAEGSPAKEATSESASTSDSSASEPKKSSKGGKTTSGSKTAKGDKVAAA